MSQAYVNLKRLCHEMNNLFEGLKIQISAFCICADSYKFFGWLITEKRRDKVWLASMKTLTNCENSSSNPLVAAYRKPPAIL